jgi:predicted O-methyltransferase YrrM
MDLVKMSIRFVTVGEMSLPGWMESYAQRIFGIPTHMTVAERLMLMQTALELPEGFVVVEIGSYLGASTAFLGAAAVQRGGTVHAVDTWMNDAMGAEGSWNTWNEFRENTQLFADYIVAHRGTSVDVQPELDGIVCDMLFIDGDHSYDAVVTDLRTWLPSLKPGGVLAMHDIDAPTVRQAYDDLIGPNCIQMPHAVDRLMICRPQPLSAIATNAAMRPRSNIA